MTRAEDVAMVQSALACASSHSARRAFDRLMADLEEFSPPIDEIDLTDELDEQYPGERPTTAGYMPCHGKD